MHFLERGHIGQQKKNWFFWISGIWEWDDEWERGKIKYKEETFRKIRKEQKKLFLYLFIYFNQICDKWKFGSNFTTEGIF